MPRFYMHIRDGEELIVDAEGCTFPDIDAASEEARVAIREMLAERIRQGEVIDGQAIEISDETGRTLMTIPFKDSIKLQ